MSHLVWNLMAIYHVIVVFPHLNDLIDYEAKRRDSESKVAAAGAAAAAATTTTTTAAAASR